MHAAFIVDHAHGVIPIRQKIAVTFYTLLLNAVLWATQSGLLLLVLVFAQFGYAQAEFDEEGAFMVIDSHR